MPRLDVTDLNPEELVLVLMHYSDGSIPGALYLQKLVFLTVHEDERRRNALQGKVRFRPLNFGPYSESIRKAVANLEKQGFIVSRTQLANKYNQEVFMLTDSGRIRSAEHLSRLSPEANDYVRTLCLAAKQLGYSGILRYVYSKYPEFTSKSQIKDEVFKSYEY